MTDIDFPASLPGPLNGSFSEAEQASWVEDRGEVGASDRRQRFTRSLLRFSFKMRITEAQMLSLRAFYDTTLHRGTLPFNWTLPVSGQTYEVQFVSRPAISHQSGNIWDADIQLAEI